MDHEIFSFTASKNLKVNFIFIAYFSYEFTAVELLSSAFPVSAIETPLQHNAITAIHLAT